MQYTIKASVECEAIYTVESNSEDEAISKWEQGNWAEQGVEFSHYSSEDPGDIISVRADR